MGFILFLFALLSSFSLANATAEAALRKAILAPGASTFILKENIVFTDNLPPILSNKKLMVIGECNLSKCALDFRGKYWGFQVPSDSRLGPLSNITLVLKNIIIRNMHSIGVLIQSDASTTFTAIGVDFICGTLDKGGNVQGLNINEVGLFQIKDCTFSGFTTGDALLTSALRFNAYRSTFRDGSAISIGFGTFSIDSCSFSRVLSNSDGSSAIDISRSDGGTISRCSFTDNIARKGGAALRVVENPGTVVIKKSVFTRNIARGEVDPPDDFCDDCGPEVPAGGGAIIIINSDVSIVASTFEGNRALQQLGGAFFVNNFPTSKLPRLSLCRVTFKNNSGVNKTQSNGYIVGSTAIATERAAVLPLVTVATGGSAKYVRASCSR